MKKIVISIITVILILVSAYFSYTYYNGTKITDGLVSKNVDKNGKPLGITTAFSPKDTVYFSAKRNRFWIRKAEVVWYKGKVATANRLLVEEDIRVSNGGYFTAKLSVPEGLEEGHYNVSIYVAGKDITETHAEFDVKR